VVAAASLPHDAAQAILSYLNQGGRLPARLQLQLDPPALGKMTVHLALDAGTLSVTFVTASSHARDAVAAGLPQMRELLDRNNLVLGHTGVYVGTQSGGRGNAGGNPGFARQGGTDTRMPASPAAEENQSQSRSGSSLLNILV
jgi:flagellar hook-length control protein FliK